MTTAQDLPATPLATAPALRLVETPTTGDLDFDAFVRRYETRLRRLVLRRLGDPGEAEEITQETLLRAYQHRASFSAEDELIAWSTVVAQRLVIDRVRVRGRAVAVAEVPEGARVGRDTADIVVARAEARTALEALEAIPERQAAILWAREVEGLHYDDIAVRFGITEPAVRSLLHRGRRALRKEYARRGGSLPLGGLIPLAPWLVALKKLGKVRTAAKAATPTALGAIAIATATAIGIAGFPQTPTAAPERSVMLSPGTAERSAYVLAMPPRDPEVLAGALRRPAGPTATGPGRSDDDPVGKIASVVYDTCVPGTPCVHHGHTGDEVEVGPELPANPTDVRRIGYASENLPLCTLVPNSAVTECRPGTSPKRSVTPARIPAPGETR